MGHFLGEEFGAPAVGHFAVGHFWVTSIVPICGSLCSHSDDLRCIQSDWGDHWLRVCNIWSRRVRTNAAEGSWRELVEKKRCLQRLCGDLECKVGWKFSGNGGRRDFVDFRRVFG